VDVAFVIRKRLVDLGLEQRDLARAAHVTESYVSQLLTGKKAPPAPNRTAIYNRMDACLKLPSGELAKMAELARKEELKRELGDTLEPLFPQLRALILRKCRAERGRRIRSIVERQPFGEVERLVAQKLLDVAGLSSDTFHLSAKQLASLDALIETWDIDLATFGMKIVLTSGLGREQIKEFEFVEKEPEHEAEEESGLGEFLQDTSMSGDITQEELDFLKRLRFRFKDKRPAALYYYRELQNLRDPLHFQSKGSR